MGKTTRGTLTVYDGDSGNTKLYNVEYITTPRYNNVWYHGNIDSNGTGYNATVLSPKICSRIGKKNNIGFRGFVCSDKDLDPYCKYENTTISRQLVGLLNCDNTAFTTLPIGDKDKRDPKTVKFQDVSIGFYDIIVDSIKLKYYTGRSFNSLFNEKLLSDISFIRYKKFNRSLDHLYLSTKDFNWYHRDTHQLVYTSFPETSHIFYGSQATTISSTDALKLGENYGAIRKSLSENFFGTNFAVESFSIDYDSLLEYIKSQVGSDNVIIDKDFNEKWEVSLNSHYYSKILLYYLFPDYNLLEDTITIDGITYELDFDNKTFKNLETNEIVYYVVYTETEETEEIESEKVTKQYIVFLDEAYVTYKYPESELYNLFKDIVLQYNQTYNDIPIYTTTDADIVLPGNHLANILNLTTIETICEEKEEITDYFFEYDEELLRHIFLEYNHNFSIIYGDRTEEIDDEEDYIEDETEDGDTTDEEVEDETEDGDTTDEEVEDEIPEIELLNYAEHLFNIYKYPTTASVETTGSLLANSIIGITTYPLYIESTGEYLETQNIAFNDNLKTKYRYFTITREPTDDDLYRYPFEKHIKESEEEEDEFKELEYPCGIPLPIRKFYLKNGIKYNTLKDDLSSTAIYNIFKIYINDKVMYFPISQAQLNEEFSTSNTPVIIPTLPSPVFSILMWHHWTATKTVNIRVFYGLYKIKIDTYIYARSTAPYTFFNTYSTHTRNFFRNLQQMIWQWDIVENPEYIDQKNGYYTARIKTKEDGSTYYKTRNVSRVYKDKNHSNHNPRIWGTRKGLGYKSSSSDEYEYDDRNPTITGTDDEGKFSSYFTSDIGTNAKGSTNRTVTFVEFQQHFAFNWYLNSVVRRTKTLKKFPAKYCDYLCNYYEITENYNTYEFVLPTRVPNDIYTTKLKIKRKYEIIKTNSIDFDEDTAEMHIYSKYTNYKYTIDFNVYCPQWKDILSEKNRINFVSEDGPLYPALSSDNLNKFNFSYNINNILAADKPMVIMRCTLSRTRTYIETTSYYYIRWNGNKYTTIVNGETKYYIQNGNEYILTVTPVIDLTNYGYKLYSKNGTSIFVPSTKIVVSSNYEETYCYYIYYKPIAFYYLPYFSQTYLTNVTTSFIKSASSSMTYRTIYLTMNAFKFSYVNGKLGYLDNSDIIRKNLQFSSLTTQQLLNLYKNYIDPESTLTIENIYNISSFNSFELEDTINNFETELNEEYLKELDEQYSETEDAEIDYSKFITLLHCYFNTDSTSNNYLKLNDHEIKINLHSYIYNNYLQYKQTYELKTYEFAELDNKVLDDTKSIEELFEDFTTYIQKFKTDDNLIKISKLFQSLINNEVTETEVDLKLICYIVNQLLYIYDNFNVTAYADYIEKELNIEYINTLINTNTISRDDLIVYLQDYVLNKFFITGSLLALDTTELQDEFINIWYQYFENSSDVEYYDYFGEKGILTRLDPNWITVNAEGNDLDSILSFNQSPSIFPEYGGTVTYQYCLLPLFEKVWNKASYPEKKFIQHCGAHFNMIGIAPSIFLDTGNIDKIKKHCSIVTAIIAIVLIVAAIVLIVVGALTSWCGGAALIMLGVGLLSYGLYLFTISILEIIAYSLGRDHPAFKKLMKVIDIINTISPYILAIVNIITGIFTGGVSFGISDAIMLAINIGLSIASKILEQYWSASLNSLMTKLEYTQQQILELELEYEANLEIDSDDWRNYVTEWDIAGIRKTREFYDTYGDSIENSLTTPFESAYSLFNYNTSSDFDNYV